MWQNLIKPKIKDLGAATRIENAAATSVPDAFLQTTEACLWIELKVAKGEIIKMPKFQYSFGITLNKVLPSRLFQIVLWHTNQLRFMPWCGVLGRAEPDKSGLVRVHVPISITFPLTDVRRWAEICLQKQN